MGRCEANLLYVESHFCTTRKLFTVFLPIEALNLIVESKSLPIEVNNATIELHLPVEAKEKLAIIILWILISLL